MQSIKVSLLCFVIIFLFTLCTEKVSENSIDINELSWSEIEKSAKGQTVNFMMWQGDPDINDYINNYVNSELKERHGIKLNIIGGQGPEIVQLIMGEKQANVRIGQADMVWINGETFFQLRKIEGLWGPFVKQLPNSQYIDFENKFINTDFQQPIDDLESPWGISQFALIHDADRAPNPPKDLNSLAKYVKDNPGTFTISNDFTGMTLLKSFLAELSGSPTGLNGVFDEDKYQKLSSELWEFINTHKKYFWKEGTTFPKEHSKMDQMFANGEINVSYGFSEGGIEAKVRSGLFPKSTKAYAWENGTIKNANYLGISYNSAHKAAAMVVINFLISPEAQLKKADPTGMDSNPVLSVEKLPLEWKDKFEATLNREYGASLDELSEKAISEPAPEYMIRLYEDFRKQVIEK